MVHVYLFLFPACRSDFADAARPTQKAQRTLSPSYEKEKRAKPVNLPKNNDFSKIWEHWIEKYIYLFFNDLMNTDALGKKVGGSVHGLV